MQLKDKESNTSSQDITSSLVSTTVDDPTIQSKEKKTKPDSKNMVTPQREDTGKISGTIS